MFALMDLQLAEARRERDEARADAERYAADRACMEEALRAIEVDIYRLDDRRDLLAAVQRHVDIALASTPYRQTVESAQPSDSKEPR